MGKTIRETMQEFTVNQALKYLEEIRKKISRS